MKPTSPPVVYSLAKIEETAARIHDAVLETPVLTSNRINELAAIQTEWKDQTRIQLFFKCENLQNTGSFKIRGATNVLRTMSDEQLKQGVVVFSTGTSSPSSSSSCFLVSSEPD